MRSSKYFLILFTATLSAFGFEYHLEPYTISQNVDCFFGLHDKAKSDNGGRVINTCYIKSDKGYVVIDSGPTYAYAQQAYTAMQKKEKLPVKYVINTSAEELHILGNEFYKEQGATLIGPKSYEKRIKEQKPLSMLEKLSNAIFTNTRLIPLDIYQNEDKTIMLGKTQIEIKKLEKSDSKNLVVYLPKEETIFVGNFVSNKRVPTLKEHDSIDEWMKNLQTIEAMSWKHIISSHGVKHNRKALTCTKKYLSKIKQTVLESIKNPSKDINNTSFGTCEHIAFFSDFHTDNIQKAYDELKHLPHSSKDSNEEAILMAMSTIKTEETLKEGTTKSIVFNDEDSSKKEILSKKIEKKSEPNIAKIEKPIKLAKEPIEVAEETSINTLISEASKIEVAPTTEEFVPSINYNTDFFIAQQDAIKEHKMVLIKVEADDCEPCAELDQMLADNKNIRKMINTYTKAVKVNTSYDNVPLGLTNRGTPTVFVINPSTEKVVLKLEGLENLHDLEASLRSIIPKENIPIAFYK